MYLRILKQTTVGDTVRSYCFEPGNHHTGITDWGNCTRCRLCHTRKRVAIKRTGGTGHTRLLFIGEAPGELENATGVPFVGVAGKILHQLFKLVHFQFQYQITNVVGCRPVDVMFLDEAYVDEDYTTLDSLTIDEDYQTVNWNREPVASEIEHCKPHIDEMLESFKPHGVVYLGKVAQSYNQPKYPVTEDDLLSNEAQLFRHSTGPYRHPPTLSLFHPAYIARLEYKLLALKKEARKLERFVERFMESK